VASCVSPWPATARLGRGEPSGSSLALATPVDLGLETLDEEPQWQPHLKENSGEGQHEADVDPEDLGDHAHRETQVADKAANRQEAGGSTASGTAANIETGARPRVLPRRWSRPWCSTGSGETRTVGVAIGATGNRDGNLGDSTNGGCHELLVPPSEVIG